MKFSKPYNHLIKKIVSILLIISLTMFSFLGVHAQNSTDDEKNLNLKIKASLAKLLEKATEAETISVYIWYEDVNQQEIDKVVEQKTGLTRENCKVLKTNKTSLNTSEFNISDYIKSTKQLRLQEQRNVNKYIIERRAISRQTYKIKSTHIKESLNIDEKEIIFVSQYAPMIIAELSKDEIIRISTNSKIEEIGYYEKEIVNDNQRSGDYYLYSTETMKQNIEIDKIDIDSDYALSGDNIKVGIIDNDRVHLTNIDSNDERLTITPDTTSPQSRTVVVNNTNSSVNLTDYGNIVIVGDLSINNNSYHSTMVSKVLLSVAPNVTIYNSNDSFINVEAMITEGVNVLSLSIGTKLETNDPNYAYTIKEKWYDHIIANDSIVVIKSAGNVITERVTSPGLAYNIITVGSYYNSNLGCFPQYSNDTSYPYSFINSYNNKKGCEKPDVIMPSPLYYNQTQFAYPGTTSMSTPMLTGTIALMYELQPYLINFPQIIKAVILASCHRKVNHHDSSSTETMEQGFTDRQGAGVPNANIMAQIICQGTYGYGKVNGSESKVFFEQPKYKSNKMNVSITWLKENSFEEGFSHININNHFIETPASDLFLSVYRNNSLIANSDLEVSSTEMCYFSLNPSSNQYKIKIGENITGSGFSFARYAYAWSTDAPYTAPLKKDGIYYLRSHSNERFLTYYPTSQNVRVYYNTVNTSNSTNDYYYWILKESTSNNVTFLNK